MVHGELKVPRYCTTSQGSCLDYVVMSKPLCACSDVVVEADVPFAPHLAVLLSIRKAWGQAIVRQLPQFIAKPTKQGKSAGKNISVVSLPGATSQEPLDISWAAFTSEVEAGMFEPSQSGRAAALGFLHKPLLGDCMEGRVWRGGPGARWRLLLACAQGLTQGLRRRRLQSLKNWILDHYDQSWIDMDGVDGRHFCTKLSQAGLQSLGPQDFKVLQYQATEHQKKWQRDKTQQYESWLESAVTGGMRGLFRALKSPEANLDRPYRDVPCELRPHVRRAWWFEVWQPRPRTPQYTEKRQQLRDKAVAQFQQLPPHTAQSVQKAVKKLATKAMGADGWSAEMFRALDLSQCAVVAEHFNNWERSGSMAWQAMVSIVALIPKSTEEERPIALTPYPYRLWARTRWGLFQEWVDAFVKTHTWDRARKGLSSLDVALKRAFKAEILQVQKRHGATLLLDLKGFYERVTHDSVLDNGDRLRFPPAILHFALLLYENDRVLVSEGMASEPIRASRGILAGCPFAPAISKLSFEHLLAPVWQSGLVTNLDLYLDDTGYDCEAATPAKAARNVYRVYQHVSQALDAAGLPISINKTAFLCSNRQVRKELQGYLKPCDPPIKAVAKDLGVDAALATRRRVSQHRKRWEKGKKRANRLRTLSLKNPTKALQAFRAGVQAAGLYGHESVGVPPKRMKWLRGVVAGFAGRKKLGATDIMIDFRSGKPKDPQEAIMAQHFRTYHRLLVAWGDTISPEMHQAFMQLWHQLKTTAHPWKVAKGPASAAICYMLELGWRPNSASAWVVRDEVVNLATVQGLGRLLQLLHVEVNLKRWAKIADMEDDPQLQAGLDWQPHAKLLARAGPVHRNALQSVWQGALRADNKGKAWCSRCGCEATDKHVLWDCQWWQNNFPEPEVFQRWRKEYPYPSLWTRGLVPRVTKPDDNMPVVTTGLWQDGGVIEDATVFYATDGSPGAGNDPRLQHHTWAALAYRVDGGNIVPVATAAGPVHGQQSVYRSEVSALAFVCARARGILDVTTDCKAMCARVQRGKTPPESADLLEPILEESARLHLVWVKSHLTEEQFRAKFPALPKWRHAANQMVDALAQEKAESRRQPKAALYLKRRDAVVTKVNQLLRDRMVAMLNYDKDQGPQVEFKEKPQGAPGRTARTGVKSNPVFQKAKEPKPNKRRILEALLRGEQNKEHSWVQGSAGANMTIQCSKCGLFMQQTDAYRLFQVKLNQGCIGTVVAPPGVVVHSSHNVLNLGKEWTCTKCGRTARMAMQAAAWLGDVCAGRITTHGKDARARRAKVEAAIKLCNQDPLAQQREKRPKLVQGVVAKKESQGQQKLTFGVQQLQSRSGGPPGTVAETRAQPVKEGPPAEAAQSQVCLERWFGQPAGAIEVAAPKPDGPEARQAQEPGQQSKKPPKAGQERASTKSGRGNRSAQGEARERDPEEETPATASRQKDRGEKGGQR